ncbi:MAG: hypothetical protein JXA30_00375 [Deltaproteobacteria bacterium]|nr:hypothetical protein [Deltaproteobacteria bacterium]
MLVGKPKCDSLKLVSIIFALSLIPSVVMAQKGGTGVARSGMEQGEATVAVRSDISLAIRGTGGTTKSNLNALGEAIRSRISSLKSCYGELIEKSPIVVGKLQLILDFSDEAKHPKLDFSDAKEVVPALQACIRKSLGKATLKPENRPAAAVITLDFSNTRARGQQMLESRAMQSEKQRIIDVKENDAGMLESEWSSIDGKLSFVVTADTSVSKQTVADVQGVLRSHVGRFLDCRRRSSKGGVSPAGEAVLDVRIQSGGDASMRIRSISIAHQRASICIEGVFRKLKFNKSPKPFRVTITIRFGP